MPKTVAILGATGSVGTQALDVVRASGYKLDYIAAGSDVDSAERYAREFSVRFVALADEGCAKVLKERLADTDITVLSGEDGITEGIRLSEAESFVNAITGMAGLAPTLEIIEKKARLCLANKESLVIAGDIVTSRARELGVEILPVDSEHSAIYQSLKAGKPTEVKKIILTASGGPFFSKTAAELSGVTPEDTLRHPTWKMGKKITVDSATLMNKAFEIIEAAHLFGLTEEKIEVVIHRESILHSAVEYVDNSIIGELSVPDMRSCIQYALDYPERKAAKIKPLDLVSLGKMSFFAPDTEAFPALNLAKRVLRAGGASGAVLNAADEVAVAAFLGGKIGFTDIARTVEATLDRLPEAKNMHTKEELYEADRKAREIALAIIQGEQN